MDTSFPYFNETDYFQFPDVNKANPEGIVGMEGNLSPGMLLSAYRQGIFPWYSEGEPILWWSPDPRMVLFPKNIHISKSMKRTFTKNRFSFSMDNQFREVINSCGGIPRKHEDGTWITSEMKDAYTLLHELGWGHSVEVWDDNELVGGLYGLSIGSVFFGESMFSLKTDASKAAYIFLAQILGQLGFSMIDCQLYTPHLESLGAEKIDRQKYMSLLNKGLEAETRRGKWNNLIDCKGTARRATTS
ncbi:MAG: leucyl/phenylalanyl-tRNA--protein transferase [Spirochaetia bacterium]|jgi:leucyl/phenylalanyl-tRNA--protein transferase|nr:leucyl/phenylalanyl-tRNA--protein transferase [Spirochaetia bacterium]